MRSWLSSSWLAPKPVLFGPSPSAPPGFEPGTIIMDSSGNPLVDAGGNFITTS